MNKKNKGINLQLFADGKASDVVMMDQLTGKVPADTTEDIIGEVMHQSAVLRLAKYEEMTKLEKEFTFLAKGAGAYFVGEGEKIHVDRPIWATGKLVAKKLAVIIPVTNEFLDYTVKEFFNEYKPKIAEEFAKRFDLASIFGVNSPYPKEATIWENIEKTGNKIEIDSLGNLYEEINGTMALVEEADLDPNGLLTTRRMKSALRGTVDMNKRPIFNEPTDGSPDSALGLPVSYSVQEAFDREKAEIILGDWDNAIYGIPAGIEYMIADQGEIDMLDENGNKINLFQQDMKALRATMHIAFLVTKENAFAGLTPKAGTGE